MFSKIHNSSDKLVLKSEALSLENFSKKYKKVSIDQPIELYGDDIRAIKENSKGESNGVQYGILELLKGDWYSYIEEGSKRVSNLEDNIPKDNSFSGIHTTIMPSPGTTQNNIPGKFSFECEEYVEKLSFELVDGGVRNRGGANEQFCGAVKYNQSIKVINKDKDKYNDKDKVPFVDEKFKGIHEENGMYLWLDDIYKHPATVDSINDDRGVHNWDNDEALYQLCVNLYPSFNKPEGDNVIGLVHYKKTREYLNIEPIVKKHPYLDVALYNVGSIEKPEYKLFEDIKNEPPGKVVSIVPAKELKPWEGDDRPTFIPDYTLSRSGVIPHGSTITLLGDIAPGYGDSVLKNAKPEFFKENDNDVTNGTWDYDHLAISRTMGGGFNPNSPDKSGEKFDLYKPSLPFKKVCEFNSVNDPGEQKVYTQRMFLHDLYPYSIRPDLRLNDAIKNQNIKNHMKIVMSSRNKTGSQGGILNIPFVNRFVPTVEMTMNMWIETVIENNKEILQIQYEQIVFFEFGFGDNGGITSWPHIQVNTLRQWGDLNKKSKEIAKEAKLSNRSD